MVHGRSRSRLRAARSRRCARPRGAGGATYGACTERPADRLAWHRPWRPVARAPARGWCPGALRVTTVDPTADIVTVLLPAHFDSATSASVEPMLIAALAP